MTINDWNIPVAVNKALISYEAMCLWMHRLNQGIIDGINWEKLQ